MAGNLKSNEILYSTGNNDECYTLDYAVKPILEFIPKIKIVWCPFDTEDSNFVKIFKQNGYSVIHSHISEGKDFLKWQPDNFDIIVSNPPFTNKRVYFERALSFNKPFALIMSNTWLNDSTPKKIFKEKGLQLLMFEERMKFLNNGIINNKITFSSSYFCYNLLPKDIIIKSLKDYGMD